MPKSHGTLRRAVQSDTGYSQMMMPSAATNSDGLSAFISRRVILVDDDENVRRSTTMMLRARGILVDVYHTGAELLSSAGDHQGECLLIDYKMPLLDGLEVMKKLRENGDLTPGLMVTGYYSQTLEDRALQAGYSALLEKPILPARLIDAITAAIKL